MGMRQDSIAVVDDCSVSRELLNTTLRACGYPTIECGSGTQFLDLMERERPLLVLLDLCMPDINGFDILARIRQRHPLNTLPVLVVTTRDDNKDVVRALTTGANDLIVKPIDRNTFLARVYYHLNLVQMQRQHEEQHQRLMRLLTVSHAIEELSGEAIVAQDGDGRVVYCNPLMRRLVPDAQSMGVREVLLRLVPAPVLDKILGGLRDDPVRAVAQRIEVPHDIRIGGMPTLSTIRSALHGGGRIWMVQFDHLADPAFCGEISSQMAS